MKRMIWLGLLSLLLLSCSAAPAVSPDTASIEEVVNTVSNGTGIGMGMGMGSGMMERHHAIIPQEYSGMTNPVAADEASFARGGELYAINCASCHGDGGMGDGVASAGLDPAPSHVAHTSQMMGDNYLFWRISEGGAQFDSAMPAWKAILDEQTRWDLINYMRALGAGEVQPASQMGGALFDAELQAAHQAAMLAQAVDQGVITQEEADVFKSVHDAIEQYRTEHPEISNSTLGATERQAAMLAELVTAQTITQAQADAFIDVHDRLGAAGLMQ